MLLLLVAIVGKFDIVYYSIISDLLNTVCLLSGLIFTMFQTEIEEYYTKVAFEIYYRLKGLLVVDTQVALLSVDGELCSKATCPISS